ncbi:acyltransferase [Pedobacter jamesrossensis]|uniref:Acyltransferase n=1 Tax=Pedobacter jamesrossensis TaxID=1908238 RepID=A0ABV8NR41_9SPHI
MEKAAEQNLIDPAHKKNFDFIDAIRCLAMIGIVMEHSVYNGTYIFEGFPPKHMLYICLIQISKFGTIAFFVLAGFLLGDKFTSYSSWQYFKRRLSSTFMPWLIWSLVLLVAILAQRYIALHKSGDEFHFVPELISKIELVYLYTNYWFIINFMFCIAILLCFKKYLYSFWLGFSLLVFSLIYSINVYFEWFIPSHTIAIFGFIFYLWLGAICNHYWNQLEQFFRKTNILIFVCLFLITFIWAVFDIARLMNARSVDPYNTLRLSNIFYSLATLALLLKIRNFNFTKIIKPRQTTFGIYLIHYIFVVSLLPEIFRPFHLVPFQEMSVPFMLLYIFIRFIIVYGLSLATIWLLNKTKLRWIVAL